MSPTVPSGDGPEHTPRFVRPYTITAGRTRATVDLPLEAKLRRETEAVDTALNAGAQRVLDTCHNRSVAEVSALVSMPIGVVRVLLSGLVEQGVVHVEATLNESS